MLKKLILVLVPLLAFLGGAVGGDMLRGDGEAAAAADAGAGAGAGADSHGANAEAQPSEAAPAHDAHVEPAPATKADTHAAMDSAHGEGEPGSGPGFFTFPNQFFVPVVRNGEIGSVMILTVTLETAPGLQGSVEGMEHRLRDSLLRSLMIHANTGGFDGNFTAEGRLRGLRETLLTAAHDVAGGDVTAVLIEDIVRQEG